MFKRTSTLLILLSAAVHLTAAEPDPSRMTGNVTVDELYDHVTFYMDFDGTPTRPLISTGAMEPSRVSGKPVLEKGMRGKALRISGMTFSAKDIMSLRRPGTVMFWVSPWNWPEKGKDEPFFGWFSTSSKSYEYSMAVSHMAHTKFGEGRVNVYLYFPQEKHVIQNQIIGQGSPVNWKNGSWNLIVVTWSASGWAVSVNGKRFMSQVIPYTLKETERFSLGVREKDDPKEWQSLIDEFVILDVRLTDDQVRQAYEWGRKIRQDKSNGPPNVKNRTERK